MTPQACGDLRWLNSSILHCPRDPAMSKVFRIERYQYHTAIKVRRIAVIVDHYPNQMNALNAKFASLDNRHSC